MCMNVCRYVLLCLCVCVCVRVGGGREQALRVGENPNHLKVMKTKRMNNTN